jgi:hypothetical protein
MGAWKPVEAFFEPFISFSRYLPASAFIPLLILWAGIGEAQKLALIFIGAFFPMVLMVAVKVGATRRDLVEAAYTLGCTDWGVVRRVLIPASAPEIAEILRTVMGWAWTYVIVAELIGSERGIGHMITDSQAAAQHRPDHLRHHRDRRDRARFRLRVQDREPALVRLVGVSDARLAIERVSRTFPAVRGGAPTRALDDTTLEVRDNDFIAILGPSGCGKSTLLRIVAGLDTATTGRVLLDGSDVRGPGPDRGMVFQSYTLFPWLTVEENIGFGLRERGVPQGRARRERARVRGAHGARGLRAPPSAPALGRDAAAHCARPRARQRSQDPAAGRAFGALDHQTRSPHAGAAAAGLGSAPQDRALRHPRHRRGDLHGQPRGRLQRAARQDQVGGRDRTRLPAALHGEDRPSASPSTRPSSPRRSASRPSAR